MVGSPATTQRLSRLAPLPQVLASIDALARPVAPREIALAAALGRVLAADVAVAGAVPPAPVALRDGWAGRAERLSDAGPYTPQPLVPAPPFVEIGAPLPAPADAVLAADAVTVTAGAAE